MREKTISRGGNGVESLERHGVFDDLYYCGLPAGKCRSSGYWSVLESEPKWDHLGPWRPYGLICSYVTANEQSSIFNFELLSIEGLVIRVFISQLVESMIDRRKGHWRLRKNDRYMIVARLVDSIDWIFVYSKHRSRWDPSKNSMHVYACIDIHTWTRHDATRHDTGSQP